MALLSVAAVGGLGACSNDDKPGGSNGTQQQGNVRDAGEKNTTDQGPDTGDANNQNQAPRGGTDTANK